MIFTDYYQQLLVLNGWNFLEKFPILEVYSLMIQNTILKWKTLFWFLKLFSNCNLPSHSSRTCTLSPNNRESWSGDEAVNEDIAWQKK